MERAGPRRILSRDLGLVRDGMLQAARPVLPLRVRLSRQHIITNSTLLFRSLRLMDPFLGRTIPLQLHAIRQPSYSDSRDLANNMGGRLSGVEYHKSNFNF